MSVNPEPMTFFHASLLALRGQRGHDAVNDLGGGEGVRPSGEIVAQSAAGFLQRFVHFLSFDDAAFDQEIAKFGNHQSIGDGDSADVGGEIVRANHGETPLEFGESDSSGAVPITPRQNRASEGYSPIPEISGDAPKKGWTAETAGVPVTDSVEMDGVGMGEERLLRDIGPGLYRNRNRD